MAKKKEMTTLTEEIAASKKELFNLKLSAVAGQVKDTSQFEKLRRNIARAFTALRMQKAQQMNEIEK